MIGMWLCKPLMMKGLGEEGIHAISATHAGTCPKPEEGVKFRVERLPLKEGSLYLSPFPTVNVNIHSVL